MKRKQSNTGYKKHLSVEELKLILGSFSGREEHHKLITCLLAFLGLRISEVVPLKVSDFSDNFTKLNVNLKKQGKIKSRIVPKQLAEYIRWYVLRYQNTFQDGYIFTSYNPASVKKGHKHIVTQSFNMAFTRKMNELGLTDTYFKDARGKNYHRITPHTLRHFFVTQLLKSTNGNLPLVCDIIGHVNVRTTHQYFYDPASLGIEGDVVNKSTNGFFGKQEPLEAKQPAQEIMPALSEAKPMQEAIIKLDGMQKVLTLKILVQVDGA